MATSRRNTGGVSGFIALDALISLLIAAVGFAGLNGALYTATKSVLSQSARIEARIETGNESGAAFVNIHSADR